MLKLLLVGGDAVAREMLARWLCLEGFGVVTASNVVQTLALARSERPALILLDVDLPLLDGWQVAGRLRAIAQTRAIPIVVLAEAPPELPATVECDDYELKPLNLPRLLAKIRWLAGPGQSGGLNTRQAGVG